jgi:protein-S-isoprenylcysteine O-methyltransferase Ste14
VRNEEEAEMANAEKRTASLVTLLKVLAGLAITAMIIAFARFVLLHAHRLGWTLGWIYVGIIIATWLTNLVCLGLWNPELIERRMRFGKGVKTWDKVWILLFTLVLIAIFFVVNFEMRGTVPKAPGAAWLIGFALYVPGWALIIWSMVVNPFFEKMVRIQTDHGHHVIEKGPYAYVRHPGYLGIVGWIVSTPLLLASAWAFIPALITVILLVIRTALEDRTLKAELPGYADYADRARFRLVPGVW